MRDEEEENADPDQTPDGPLRPIISWMKKGTKGNANPKPHRLNIWATQTAARFRRHIEPTL